MDIGRYRLNDPDERDERCRRRYDPDVERLNRYVDELRERTGYQTIPYFDPASGGIRDHVLLLAQDPGPRALASGFISPCNPDPSAARTTELRNGAGLAPGDCAYWNVIPWYVGTPTAAARAQAAPELARVLAFFAELRAVILLGKAAEKLWDRMAPSVPATAGLTVCRSSHPSARGQMTEALRRKAREAFACAQAALDRQ